MKNRDQTLELHKLPCDRCGGDGKNYSPSVAEYLKRWRVKSGLSQREMSGLMKMHVSTLARFENGRYGIGEQSIRRYIQMLVLHEEESRMTNAKKEKE